jgi:hypothetical protein
MKNEKKLEGRKQKRKGKEIKIEENKNKENN